MYNVPRSVLCALMAKGLLLWHVLYLVATVAECLHIFQQPLVSDMATNVQPLTDAALNILGSIHLQQHITAASVSAGFQLLLVTQKAIRHKGGQALHSICSTVEQHTVAKAKCTTTTLQAFSARSAERSILTCNLSLVLLISPAFMALTVLLVNKSKAFATQPSSASADAHMRAKDSLMRISASSCLTVMGMGESSVSADDLACRAYSKKHTLCRLLDDKGRAPGVTQMTSCSVLSHCC